MLSRKGGSGKTTLAVNLALMAFLRGRKVLLADIDPQRSASDALRARGEPGPALADITAGKLFLTKSNAMRDGVDYLFIDTPALPEADVAQAVNIADVCLVAGRPSFLDLAPIVRTAEAVRRLGKGGMVVLNQAHTNRSDVAPVAFPEIMEALRFCGLPLAPHGLRSREAFQKAMAQGRCVAELEPGGPAARDLERLWAHVEASLDGVAGGWSQAPMKTALTG
ncbi:AAA family ATPase [Caulobacter sp. UNC279MFTsu5.1]|uniref:AAA family ATPase n=1 Tax=Caulobacter sp. UNC279MFTsu5.1 TaxID=1502775 RepID=UPI002101BF68|nr:AAA family ATPase [Caulobacter sp. UNC279MFTsu5.1]